MINRTLTVEGFVSELYQAMGLNSNFKYKAIGRLANSPRGIILVFDFEDVLEYTGEIEETLDEKTGKVKKKEAFNYRNNYSGLIGKTYEEYENEQHVNTFEDVGEHGGYAVVSS